jgi:hypothetical protein
MKTIIEMAGKAFETPGVEPAFRNGFWTVTSEELERFAALVAAAEREACAKVADEYIEGCEGTNFGVGKVILARGQA